MTKFKHSLLVVVTLGILFALAPSRSDGQATMAGRERISGRAAAPAEVTVTFSEAFLNEFFDAVFTHLRKPSYPLSLIGQANTAKPRDLRAAHAPRAEPCTSQVVLEREISGIKTEVHFRDGRIEAPLAFSGSYPLPLVGCLDFTGWAEATVDLSFDQAKQTLNGRVNVNDVHVSGVPNLTSGVVTRYVQSSLDQKINPVEILRAEQLSALIPVKPSGGSLRLRARDIRTEVAPGELRLRIDYEFVKGE